MFVMNGLIAQASNIKSADHPPYTTEDFLKIYPQYRDVLPQVVLEAYVNFGLACVSYQRFNAMWQIALGLFIAHFCTLHLQSQQEAGTDIPSVLAAGAATGIVSSESADGVSYSQDFSSILNDLSGWGTFKLTTYGAQFATMARMVGKGGMYVW